MAFSKPGSHTRSESSLETAFKSPLLFALLVTLVSLLYTWPKRWIISSAPFLQFLVLVGEYQGYRVLPGFHLWPLFTTLNLLYSICSTSWLLYWVFSAACYAMVSLVSVCQFESVASLARRVARAVLRQMHFIGDKVAFFDIPALEIDTEVDGLMVLRGITFSLSTLSFVVHGVEVGIKLSDDMELAISTDKVEVRLFRGIDVGDCFANLKGGEFEMTFGKLEGKSKDKDGDQVFVEGTPLLRAASREADRRGLDEVRSIRSMRSENEERKMTARMTEGSIPEDSTARDGLESMEHVNPDSDNDEESKRYKEMIDFIQETSCIYEARRYIYSVEKGADDKTNTFSYDDDNAVRAAICSQLHSKPSVPHPPSRSIKVTTLQNLAPPYFRRFLHRLPMLLRLLLNPLAYFHPVNISSITATASGAWINKMVVTKVFQSSPEDADISAIQKRISAWLTNANFVVELGSIIGLAQVPYMTTYDIICRLAFSDVMAYRSLPAQTELNQVVRLGGADAGFIIPAYLLPHHEHLLPDLPSPSRRASLEGKVEEADGKPKELQAERELEQAEKDETNVKISVHARLPACFDQELLDWVATLVKATKWLNWRKQIVLWTKKVHGIMEFGRALRGGLKEGVKKVVVDGVVNERWIAKMVGKITRKLETAQGEFGYTGDIPVALDVYRTPYLETEGEKILP